MSPEVHIDLGGRRMRHWNKPPSRVQAPLQSRDLHPGANITIRNILNLVTEAGSEAKRQPRRLKCKA